MKLKLLLFVEDALTSSTLTVPLESLYVVAIKCTITIIYIYIFILTKLYINSTLYSKCSFMEM